MRILLIIFCILTLSACEKEKKSVNIDAMGKKNMEKDILLNSISQWDAKQTLEIYEYSSFEDSNLIQELESKSNQGNLGAEVVLLKFQQDQAIRHNSPVDLFDNEFYELGLKGQPLAASYAASSIHEVDQIQDIKQLDEIIKIQKKLLEIGVKGGVIANFPFYISLLLLKEDESSKIDNDWIIKKEILSKISTKDLQNIININHYLSKTGYEISPIYFMQMYYYGYGVKKDTVEACAWAKNVNKDLINNELIDLIKKIESEQLTSTQKKQCKELTEIYKKDLHNDYGIWLKSNSIVYKSEVQKILYEYNIKF